MPSVTQKTISPSFLIFVFIGMIFSEWGYSSTKTTPPETLLVLPSSSTLKALDFGLDTATASLLWLKINQGVYTWIDNDHKYERFSKEIIAVTEIDPKWDFPYSFGILLLPSLGATGDALYLGEKGMQNIPNDWRIPYSLATVYHSYRDDRLNAAKYFSIAAANPTAPENIKTISFTYGTATNKKAEMELIWQTLLDTSDNEVVKEQAKRYLQALHGEK